MMKAVISLLFCLSITIGMAQTYSSSAINKNNQAMTMANRYSHDEDSLKKAICLLDEAIGISPAYTLAYQNKAQLFYWLGKPVEAFTVVLAAEKQDPENPYVCTAKGLLLEKNKYISEAKKSYQRSIDLFHERFKKDSGSVVDFENMLFSEFLLNDRVLSLKEINSLKKTLGLTLSTDDEKKFQNWFYSLYSSLERGNVMKGFEPIR